MHLANDLNNRFQLRSREARDFFLSVSLALFLLPEQAAAQAREMSSVGSIVFDIPAQPLAAALDRYSARTGIVAVYNGDLAAGRLSNAIRGQYSSDAALRLLLSGSGLVAQYTARDAFVLVPAPTEAAVVKAPSAIALAALAQQNDAERSYSGFVQNSINRSLCTRPETRPGDYRLAIRFRIGPSGGISNLKLLGSTGDPQRDTAILGSLETVSIGEPPPASMVQPFTMVVLPRSSGGVVNCPEGEGARQNG